MLNTTLLNLLGRLRLLRRATTDANRQVEYYDQNGNAPETRLFLHGFNEIYQKFVSEGDVLIAFALITYYGALSRGSARVPMFSHTSASISSAMACTLPSTMAQLTTPL
jgi:hypothetical protein